LHTAQLLFTLPCEHRFIPANASERSPVRARYD
jgi:hypothetical protein